MKNKICLKLKNFAERFKPFAFAFFRIIIGAAFMAPGYMKLMNPAMGIGAAQGAGFPIPEFFGWLLILTEFVGGLFLILGLFTRFVTIPMMFVMLVAFFAAHLKSTVLPLTLDTFIAGFIGKGGYELVLILFASLLIFFARGAQEFSLDKKFCKGEA